MLLAATGPIPAAAADVAEEILAKGIEAYQAGKLEPAIGGINAALRGRLSAAQMARAYYYRGLTYRKQGNPGRAISDFGTALEYPGLTDAERSDVQESREAAYREAGISEGERVVVATARETSAAPSAPETPSFQTRTIVTTGAVSASQPAAKPAPSPPPTTNGWSGSAEAATMAPRPNAPKDLPRPAAKAWTASELIDVGPLPAVAPTKARPAPQSEIAAGQPAVAAPPPPLAKPREAPAAKSLPPFVTQVAAITPAMPVATVAPPVVPQAAPPPVHIVVGEVRSASEAFALSIRLISQRGAALGQRKPEIMHATMANGEILYRLRLGPYAAASDALALCQSLRDSGYACITQ